MTYSAPLETNVKGEGDRGVKVIGGIEGKVCDYLKWLFISQTPDPYNHVQHQLKGLCLFQLFTHRA